MRGARDVGMDADVDMHNAIHTNVCEPKQAREAAGLRGSIMGVGKYRLHACHSLSHALHLKMLKAHAAMERCEVALLG